MTRKSRLEYLVCTLSVLVTGFIVYGFVGSIEPLINESKLQSFFVFGCLGGFGFSAIVSTIILSVGFFKKRDLKFKIIASVLWPITFAVCVYVGILSYVPYQIFNVVKLSAMSENEDETLELKPDTQD